MTHDTDPDALPFLTADSSWFALPRTPVAPGEPADGQAGREAETDSVVGKLSADAVAFYRPGLSEPDDSLFLPAQHPRPPDGSAS